MIAKVLIIARDHEQACTYADMLALDRRQMQNDVFCIISLKQSPIAIESRMWDLIIVLSDDDDLLPSDWAKRVKQLAHMTVYGKGYVNDR